MGEEALKVIGKYVPKNMDILDLIILLAAINVGINIINYKHTHALNFTITKIEGGKQNV